MHETRSLVALAVVLVLVVLSTRRAAGRLGPRISIGSLVFLATRWPVLVVWVVGAVSWLVYLVPRMQARGFDSVGNYATAAGLAWVCGGGLAVLVVGPVFLLARAFTPAPVLTLGPGETVLLECGGGHFLAGEGRGGKLLVTSKRLAFRPHRFNVQLSTWSLPLADVERIESGGAHLLVVHARAPHQPEYVVTPFRERIADCIAGVMPGLAR